ncbi:APTX [Acanthosepion pharaonis]|uniref:APTX n=1 Tax=Acanthosepion pharaonis TaxID=158019 RepID=A0A812EMV9_ACAPH|nr:APTX [Sepia pharaonis]
MGLLASMEDPKLRVEADDKIVIIKDKYPKAKYHFLVLPKEKIPNMKSVNKDHIQLLKHMHDKGTEIAEKSDSNLQFRYGYHAIPSMGQLHLHVISQDFNSPCLKTKKHWNSFVTEYFIDSTEIIKQLEDKGKIEVDKSKNEELLKKNLRCHVCKATQSNMPTLKAHIATHNYNKKK